MTSWRDCLYVHVFLYMPQSVILSYSEIIATNPEATPQRLWLQGTSSSFSPHWKPQPMSWRVGSNAALGNAEPRGIQRLRLFRQSLRRAHPALRAVNTKQLSPESAISPTELTAGQLGGKLGTETQEEEQELSQTVSGKEVQIPDLATAEHLYSYSQWREGQLLSSTPLWCCSKSFTVYIQSDNNRKPSVTATATMKWGAIS